jgi:hypothetical protein
MEEDYITGRLCVQMVWRVAGLDSGGVPHPLFLGVVLTMHVLKSQIHLLRQSL